MPRLEPYAAPKVFTMGAKAALAKECVQRRPLLAGDVAGQDDWRRLSGVEAMYWVLDRVGRVFCDALMMDVPHPDVHNLDTKYNHLAMRAIHRELLSVCGPLALEEIEDWIEDDGGVGDSGRDVELYETLFNEIGPSFDEYEECDEGRRECVSWIFHQMRGASLVWIPPLPAALKHAEQWSAASWDECVEAAGLRKCREIASGNGAGLQGAVRV